MSTTLAPALPAGVTRPIPGELLRLALPVLASQALRIAFQWVDAFWVRGIGVAATAAVTTSVFVLWMVFSLNDIFGMGLISYVSQLLGAGDRARAGLAAYKGLRASAVLGLLGSCFGLWGTRYVYAFMGAGPAVTAQGTAYLSVVLVASPVMLVALTCEGIMRASGDTRTPLTLDLGAVALNAVLAPLLIYGRAGFPRLGITGAAVATVVAQTFLAGAYLWTAWRGHPAFPIARRAPGPPVRILGLAKVGAPAALIGSLFCLAYLAFSRAAAMFGAASLAVLGIVNRVEALEFLCAASLGFAGAALVGQNLGAGRPERAVEVIRTGLRWIVITSLALTLAVEWFPIAFLSVFTRDPEVIRIGVPYLRFVGGSILFTGIEIVTAESVMGSGHTVAISWIYSIISLVRIPLAFLVPAWTHGGLMSIAWVMVVTCVLRTVGIVVWAARGTWKRGLRHELAVGAPGATPESP